MALRGIVLIACLALAQADLIDLSCKQICAFVDGHNDARLRVASGELPDQPAAEDMKYMVWDDELAAKAGEWAARNEFSHNPDKSVESGRFTTGENLYWYATTADGTGATDVANKAVQAWFNEHADYTYDPLTDSDFRSGPDIGHYTQMVWSDSNYVGCAISQYRENNMNNFLVVCNYGPAGNYIGQAPYKQGGPVSELTCDGNCRRPYGNGCSTRG